ncbi:MAG: MlaD family protein [Patulibacter sp.]
MSARRDTQAPGRRLRLTGRGRALLAAAGCALLGGGLLAGCAGSANTTPAAGAYSVRAIFDSAAFVLPGLDVRVSGVKVGSVNSVALTDDNRAAVTFTITDDGFKDFRKDATCTIRPQALIGERYIECQLTQTRPDGATAPAALATIASGKFKGQHLLPVSQTYIPIDPDQLLSANTPSVRERLFIIVRELGAGVAGRGDAIAATLSKSNEGLRYANRILKQLADQTEMLKQLSASSDTTLASLASERSSLSGTVKNGAVVAQRLAARQSEVRASIASLNRALTEVSPTVDRVSDLTEQLKPISEDLDASSADLASIINDLPTAASRGKTAITALGPTLEQGRDVLTSSDTDALLDRLTKTASGVKTTASVLGLTLGDLRTTGGLDYLLDTIYGLAYSTNGRDANGYFLRGLSLNTPTCSVPSSVTADGCGTRLASQSGGLPRSSASSASASAAARSSSEQSNSSTTDTASAAETTAARLLFGGGR